MNEDYVKSEDEIFKLPVYEEIPTTVVEEKPTSEEVIENIKFPIQESNSDEWA